MKESDHRLLLASLDRPLGSVEKAKLEAALAASPALREAQAELLHLRETLGDTQWQFKPLFHTRVMAQVEQLSASRNSLFPELQAAFLQLSLPALALAMALLVFVFFKEPSLSVDTLAGLESIELGDVLTDALASNF